MPAKICIVTSFSGSLINFRLPLIRALLDRECVIEVLAPDLTPDVCNKLQDLGVCCKAIPMSRTGISPAADIHSLMSLRRLFCDSKPDVVLTYFAKPNIWATLAAASASVPRRIAMVEGMGYAFTENTLGKRTIGQIVISTILLCLYKLSFAVASKVIVLNPDDLRTLSSFGCLKPHKALLMVGIGVALDEWVEMPPHYSPITFTMIARLLREKGVFEFMSAAEAIKSKYPDTRFLLLGGLDDSPGSILASDLQYWTERGIVEWLGHVNVVKWLSQTSVFVLPSYREGVPRSTQEAMAMGRAIITTNAPGCRETVNHGVNGFMVQPRNFEVLAQAMEHFIIEPELIRTMGKESRLLAEERFDVNNANSKLIEAMGV